MNVMRKNADWKARRLAQGKNPLFMQDYDPDQPRDDHGRWASTGFTPDDDHKLIRNKKISWGASHHNSFLIAGTAAEQMGVSGYGIDKEAWEDWGLSAAQKAADEFLRAIWESPGSKEPLYHGFENKNGIEWKVGDTLSLPTVATAGEIDTVSYGVRGPDQKTEPTVFEFPKGTKMAGYAKWNKKDGKDFGYQWMEAIVAGKFKIVNVRKDNTISSAWWKPMVTVVRLKPTDYFNPNTKTWEKAQ